MNTTPTDPAAFDLDDAKFQLTARRQTNLYLTRHTAEELIAAVEALRERVKVLEIGVPAVTKWYREWQARAEAAETRVAELEAELAHCKASHGLPSNVTVKG